jgi:hypothetical protein
MRTVKMSLAAEVLDYIPQEDRIDFDIPSIVDDIEAIGKTDIDDIDQDTFTDILKNHDGIKSTLVDSYDDGSTYTELYVVHSPYVDQDIVYLVTRYDDGEVTYQTQRDLQGPQAQSLEDIDGYEWIDVYDMIIDAMRYL